jgi:hypothetical protein
LNNTGLAWYTTVAFILAVLLLIAFTPLSGMAANLWQEFSDMLVFWDDNGSVQNPEYPEYFDRFNEALRDPLKFTDADVAPSELRQVLDSMEIWQEMADRAGNKIYLLKGFVGTQPVYMFWSEPKWGPEIRVMTDNSVAVEDEYLYSFDEAFTPGISEAEVLYPDANMPYPMYLDRRFWFDVRVSLETGEKCYDEVCLPSDLKEVTDRLFGKVGDLHREDGLH